jgi:microcompartment protein CcmL/EutN
MHEALALLELDSVATGLATIDALTKRAEVVVMSAGVVEPGRFLILLTAPLGDLEEAYAAACSRAGSALLDRVLIPNVHPDVVHALRGNRVVKGDVSCVAVVETTSVSSVLIGCDRARKDAGVAVAGLRLAPGLGGRAYFAVTGAQHDVEEAANVGRVAVGEAHHRSEIIAMPTQEMLNALLSDGIFSVS